MSLLYCDHKPIVAFYKNATFLNATIANKFFLTYSSVSNTTVGYRPMLAFLNTIIANKIKF